MRREGKGRLLERAVQEEKRGRRRRQFYWKSFTETGGQRENKTENEKEPED